jgi:hypothetical protein
LAAKREGEDQNLQAPSLMWLELMLLEPHLSSPETRTVPAKACMGELIPAPSILEGITYMTFS